MTIIGIDLDGVCANYTDSLIKTARELNQPIEASLGDIPTTYQMVEPRWFSSKDHWWITHLKTMGQANLITPLVQPDVFTSVLESEHRLIAVTARHHDYSNLTRQWVDTHFPGVFEEVIFTEDKHEVPIDYLVEDNPFNVASAMGQGIKVALVDYAYNQDAFPWRRVTSLEDALAEILSDINS